jgi:hypothetical protein
MVRTTNKHIDLFINNTHVCKCDECNTVVNTSFGDPREEVFKIDENGNKYGHRMLCSSCIDELLDNQYKALLV